MNKTFAQTPRPQPLSPDIAAFERGGTGQDTKAAHIPPKVGIGETTKSRAHNSQEEEGELPPPTIVSQNVGKKETTKEGKLEPVRRLSIDLPESWHRRFKTACSRTDKKMLAEVTDFIKRRTVELEKE